MTAARLVAADPFAAGSNVATLRVPLLFQETNYVYFPGSAFAGWQRRRKAAKGMLGATDNGAEAELDGIEAGEAYWLRVQVLPGALRFDFSKDAQHWKTAHTVALSGPLGDPAAIRLGKTSRRGGQDDYPERGNLERCQIQHFTALGTVLPAPGAPRSPLTDVKVRVHYELYDGLPLLAKWLTVQNNSHQAVTLNRFVVERLAVVEPESAVDGPPSAFRSFLRNLEVFSDYAFDGMMTGEAPSPAIHWQTDPLFRTQVHYERQTPCLLEAAPSIGPEALIPPGGTFESFTSSNWFTTIPTASGADWRYAARTGRSRLGCRKTRSSCTCAARGPRRSDPPISRYA